MVLYVFRLATLNRVGVAHECDGQADRQTHRQTNRTVFNNKQIDRYFIFHNKNQNNNSNN